MNASNPHFNNIGRSAYELGGLLRVLPAHHTVGTSMPEETRQMTLAALSHMENTIRTLTDGMESLGELLFIAGGNGDQPLERDHLRNIGMLIKHMAVESQFLLEERDNLQMDVAADGAHAARSNKGAAK